MTLSWLKMSTSVIDENNIIKDYFREDAKKKHDFYTQKDEEYLKTLLKKRKMWDTYKTVLTTICSDKGYQSAVDVGCGMGNLLFELHKRECFTTLVGIDVLKETFSIALLRPDLFDTVSFFQGDVFHLCFKKKSFDVVFCLNLLHHIRKQNISKAISELTRICKKTVIIEIRNKDFMFDFLYTTLVLPLYYNRLPVYSLKTSWIEKVLGKQGFFIEHIFGRKSTYRFNRRIILVCRRMDGV